MGRDVEGVIASSKILSRYLPGWTEVIRKTWARITNYLMRFKPGMY
jgi:hypothetical protein